MNTILKTPPGLIRLILAIGFLCPLSYGYTVLTHEAIIDSVWDTSLQKVLLKRFPDSTPEELVKAHAYVYGGCIVQDMGYYPFSSRLFSELTHYVRSGDFITAMIRESGDLNEYAFALGALEHYAADTDGHRIATKVLAEPPPAYRARGKSSSSEQPPITQPKQPQAEPTGPWRPAKNHPWRRTIAALVPAKAEAS